MSLCNREPAEPVRVHPGFTRILVQALQIGALQEFEQTNKCEASNSSDSARALITPALGAEPRGIPLSRSGPHSLCRSAGHRPLRASTQDQ
jgi:hypothetical protein